MVENEWIAELYLFFKNGSGFSLSIKVLDPDPGPDLDSEAKNAALCKECCEIVFHFVSYFLFSLMKKID
jgi:hypothetical protein